jgi:hypothetical protein
MMSKYTRTALLVKEDERRLSVSTTYMQLHDA